MFQMIGRRVYPLFPTRFSRLELKRFYNSYNTKRTRTLYLRCDDETYLHFHRRFARFQRKKKTITSHLYVSIKNDFVTWIPDQGKCFWKVIEFSTHKGNVAGVDRGIITVCPRRTAKARNTRLFGSFNRFGNVEWTFESGKRRKKAGRGTAENES